MNSSVLSNCHGVSQKKVLLKLQYKALKSRTEDKFEAWIMNIEERWAQEISDCLQGRFPDWRD
ncbi:MAG: hypothetical protein AB1589_01315 [Cyanobacteriota bacterium]